VKNPVDQRKDKVDIPIKNAVLHENLVNCQRLAMLGRLSAIVTHEVNNYLTAVSGYAQLILESGDAPGFETELEKIDTSALRCQKLIKEIRQVGRFINGKKEVGNINIILRSCLLLVRRQFKQESHTIIEDFSSDVPASEFDTPAVEQVFLNVIQNALEGFEEKGGTLSIATRLKDGDIAVTFEDNGPGLSEDARANLFVPFFTTKKDRNCLGLGLVASRMIMEAHGGTIAIQESNGGGTQVEIIFPLETAG
jgi:two-component system NtrC family sensor kinase